jgi:myo-inositol 2-dehydrogenase/D-chiro-inositol 1-dehydrogenase
MSKLRIAIIGCGRMGKERARCAQLYGAQVTVVCDEDSQRAEDLAASTGAGVLRFGDSFAYPGVDVVFVCTPPNCRPTPILAAIDAGIPFFVEKPVGTSSRSVDAVTAALGQRPVLNAVGYMNRYRSSVQALKTALSQTRIIGISGHWACRRYGVPWWLDGNATGGPHNEQATHLFDLLRYLAGEVTQVETVGQSAGAEQCLAWSTALRFESGATGTVFYSCEAPAKDIGVRLFTTSGSVYLDGWDFRLAASSVEHITALPRDPEDIFAIETAAFLQSVTTQDAAAIQSDWSDALRTQQLMDEAALSCAFNRQQEAACAK